MLIQFSFENFKSFRDETILDMSATKITENSNNVYKVGKEKILPLASIFGANASGKSNVLEALRYMKKYVINSFDYDALDDEKGENPRRYTSFQFDLEHREKPSVFEVYFIENDGKNKTYNYGFAIDDYGVVEEWLNEKAKTSNEYKCIFYRDKEELDLSGLTKEEKLLINLAVKTVSKRVLLVTLGSLLGIEKLKKIKDWFERIKFNNFGNPKENMILSSLIPKNFYYDRDAQKDMVNYLSEFDGAITDFEVEQIGKEQFSVKAVHKSSDGENVSIPLSYESDGTLKMFALYPNMKDVLEKGGILVVDELNSKLHPLLVRSLMIRFLDPEINKNKAQLIFTIHDSWQLENNMLRRDEIWFTEKNREGVSSLYSLAEFKDPNGEKIRKDENYEKNYLLGKYGAIPIIKFNNGR